jgi:hypothetical protein
MKEFVKEFGAAVKNRMMCARDGQRVECCPCICICIGLVKLQLKLQ